MANVISSAEHRTRPPLRAVRGKPVGAISLQARRLTVEEYHEFCDTGALDDIRSELLNGWIYEIMSPKPPHSIHVRALIKHLLPMLAKSDFVIGVQDAVTLSDSEPQPDFFVAKGPEERYRDRHPGAKDLHLIVEVSHSSRRRDRVTKLKLYAKEGIKQYWIVDVRDNRIEVHSNPKDGKYGEPAVYKPLDAIPVIVAGKNFGKLRAAKLLP
jgi:Uma2 family endonuclease